ncbi:hypothetical protein [uncultured Adlercreutzia sp.]|uniref:hypothetical protein n=1 Tax=uncultured Adlercreutzia sp. TaxID=875803 RepID=UPI0025A54C86|nr:hypothetical protein [uncultured Adlercreutzia sp.]
MEQKDPKDMTAPELLRWSAEAERDEWKNTSPYAKFICAISGKGYADTPYNEDRNIIRSFADKIDAELAQARELSLLRGAELWAKANGWPDFREGEDFGAWLDRCALKLPCDTDGEPWSIGDRVVPGNRCESTVTGYAFDGNEWFLEFRWCGIDSYANEFATSCKRPAPDVLLGDGEPVSKGETVYVIESGIGRTVSAVGTQLCEGMDGWDGSPWVMFDNGSWMHARDLTHTPPDTQERIDEDARKSMIEYWRCSCIECDNCPSVIDGKKPNEFYGTGSSFAGCSAAMMLDLLRRQRELDKRMGGAE